MRRTELLAPDAKGRKIDEIPSGKGLMALEAVAITYKEI
jgi:hypothetical protein